MSPETQAVSNRKPALCGLFYACGALGMSRLSTLSIGVDVEGRGLEMFGGLQPEIDLSAVFLCAQVLEIFFLPGE